MPRFDRDSVKKYKNRFILFVIYGVIIAIFQDIGLIIVFTAFILKGIFLGVYIFWKQAFTDDPDPLNEEIH
jgi:CDP-diacylglycerol--serine O-phosphatidyltransferase